LLRVLLSTVVLAGPRRAWFTLSLLVTALVRRPSVFKEAVSFAVVHQAFHRYARTLAADLAAVLDQLPAEDELQPPPRVR
jgi:hypothetical protein